MFCLRICAALSSRSRRFAAPVLGLLAITAFGSVSRAATEACTAPPALQAHMKAHPGVQAWIELGNWFGEQNRFACAQNAFRSALRLDPKSAQVNYLLGLSLFESHKLADAVSPLQASIQADPGVLRPHLLLGSVYAGLGQLADAASEWSAALHIDPNNDMALHGLSQALLAAQDYQGEIGLLHSAKLDPQLAIDLAVAYNAAGMTDQSVATITSALKANPNSVPLSAALVALDVKNKLYDEAERLAEKCYQAHPGDVEAQVSYMKTLVLNGDWVKARPVGQQLLTDAPHRFETLYLNGILERQAGNFTAARDHLTAAAALNTRESNLYYNLGVAYARLHDPADAIDALRKALALGDTQPETHFELANALRIQGQTDAARQQMVLYQKQMQHEAQVTVAASKTAEADQDMQKGDVQLAIQRYREAQTANPEDATIPWKLSLALDKSGDLEDEAKALQQVIAIDPTFALAQNQLGYLDSRRGDMAAAEEHFRQAVHAAPGFTQAWISLAATLGMESKFPEARDAVTSALRLDPRNAQARELSHQLTVAQNSQNPQN